MSPLLEASLALGSVVAVWFALVGWKLVPLIRERWATQPRNLETEKP